MKPFADLLSEHVAEMVGAGKKYKNLRELAAASGVHFSTISQCKNGGLPPPLEGLPGLAKALDLRGSVRDDFVKAGKRSKALSQAEAAPYVLELESEVADLTRTAEGLTAKNEHAILLLSSVLTLLTEKGHQIPKALRDKLTALGF